jgi:tRNA wybutosine-synthesizing protein 1
MYPEINALVDELHRRRISTFLVTNAQFPEKIKSLKPITQVLGFSVSKLKMCWIS